MPGLMMRRAPARALPRPRAQCQRRVKWRHAFARGATPPDHPEENRMKLYYHPVSTVSRPVVLFAADSGIPLEYQVVDLMKGEHMQEAYGDINPSRLVPVL